LTSLSLSIERAMPELEALLEQALYSRSSCSGTEEVWASEADHLTGRVWRQLSDLCGTFAFVDHRNSVGRSGATRQSLRPDYCGWSNHALIVKAEHKASSHELPLALAELKTKMSGWDPHIMRGIPFLPCYAVGGQLLQFAVLVGEPDGGVRVEVVSDPLSLVTPGDRLRILAASFNLFRILVWLRQLMPSTVVPF
jgi:hypothetical protein